MQLNRKRLWQLIVFVVFVLATVAKHAFNNLTTQLYDNYNSPSSRSIESAKRQGILDAEFQIVPMKLICHDKTYEFSEAWLEAGYEPSSFLVWFSYQRRASWDYLCVRPKTHWFHESYSFSLIPEYENSFVISGLGRKGIYFTQSGNDLYFQKVPADLRKLKITVSIETYNKGKDIVMGTVNLTRKK